ncbi:MAG TPA: hypothetical protein VFN94_05975 [Nitrospiria bacterium]|nr:hypothetical protein [Nitrospiria bacterium]
MNAEQFREALLIHGADVHRWPDEIRGRGVEALTRSIECRSLHEEYARFEAALASRASEAPSADFAGRIISAARPRQRRGFRGLTELLASCFADLRLPAPVLTVAAVLIVGLVVGLLLPAESPRGDSEATETLAFLDSTSEAL